MLWKRSYSWVVLSFRKTHIQSNGKHLQIPGRAEKKGTEEVSNTTAIASWNGWSSGMIWAELMDLLLLGNTCAGISGWSMGTCQRDWFNVGWGKQCYRCISESLSRAIYKPALCSAFCYTQLTGLWHWGCHGQQMAELSVILSLFCAGSLPTSVTDTTIWEITSEIALGKSLDFKWWQISHVAGRSVICVTNSSSKGLISAYFPAEFVHPQIPSTGSCYSLLNWMNRGLYIAWRC